MKVGDYIRTKNGNIFKIKKIDDELFIETFYYTSNDTFVTKDLILKSSPNIMDLIKEGDYVNGHRVLMVENNEIIYCPSDFGVMLALRNKDIKTIVTKEQFESMEYKIG